jgi:hypothetical protein
MLQEIFLFKLNLSSFKSRKENCEKCNFPVTVFFSFFFSNQEKDNLFENWVDVKVEKSGGKFDNKL